MCSRSDIEDFEVPYFFEASEMDFYDTPAPSEDIWKKFELLPTPPRSPKHEPASYTASHNIATLEKLQLVSDMLDFGITTDDEDELLKSKLIQDCMWSGLNLPKEILDSQCKATDTNGNTVVATTVDMSTASDCVDPAAVFPYPLNDTSTTVQTRIHEHSLGTETPSDSEDEEIDVVTVNEKVQITRRRPVLPATPNMSAQVAAMHNYSSTTPPRTPPRQEPMSPSKHNTRSPRVRSPISRHSSPQRTYHAQKRIRGSNHKYHSLYQSHHQPPIKKIRISLPQSSKEMYSVVARLKSSTHTHSHHHTGGRGSRSSSDSEDCEGCDGKRAQHNVLERKRRNDLKSSFHRLRDNVPDLRAQERAPKVVILKKATDYIHSLRRTSKSLVSELEQQRQRHEQLKRRLIQLQ